MKYQQFLKNLHNLPIKWNKNINVSRTDSQNIVSNFIITTVFTVRNM